MTPLMACFLLSIPCFASAFLIDALNDLHSVEIDEAVDYLTLAEQLDEVA